MYFRTAIAFRARSRLLLCPPYALRGSPISTTAVRRAKNSDSKPKDPMEKRETDTKPYTAEQTRSGRNDDLAKKDSSFDPSTTDPKQQKKQVREEEEQEVLSSPKRADKKGQGSESGSLDVSPAEEDVSKDYDKSDEEVSSSRQRGEPSTFVKTPNHQAEAEGNMSSANTGREKFKKLRKGKEDEPDYYQP